MLDSRRHSVLVLLASLGTILFVAGCTSPLLVGTTGSPSERIARLQDELQANPDSAALRRDLGALYVRTSQPDKARRTLSTARQQLPTDPKTLFYLGLAREQAGNDEGALALFRQYTDVPTSSRFHQLMRGRYEQLRRQVAQADIRKRARQDTTMALEPVEDAIAPFPLAYQGDDPKYEPLGRGIAELVLSDLANVDQLTVVERIRLQALRRELELSRSKYVDPDTAPRVGRLVGATRLVGGSYDVTAEKEVQVNVQVTDLRSGAASPIRVQPSGELSALVALTNDLVLRIVDRLGITLTAEERAAIETVPTRNLEAFLAYSRALEEEDRGNYRRAATLYRQAAQADPSFQQAVTGAAEATAIEAAGGSVSDAAQAGATGPGGQALNLKQLRQQNLGARGRAGGDQGRQPAAEATGTTLNAPPETPDRQDGGS